MRRILVSLAAVAFVTASLAAAPAASAGGGHGGGHDGGQMGGGGHMGGGSSGGGHDKNASVVPGARKIRVTATSFKFKPKTIAIQAGEDVTIVLTSKDVFHDFMVQGLGHVVGAKTGKTRQGGLMIDEPGTYRFWCSVTGHRGAGMKGTIVVE
jgi:cytochrome c oxidase subunit 2